LAFTASKFILFRVVKYSNSNIHVVIMIRPWVLGSRKKEIVRGAILPADHIPITLGMTVRELTLGILLAAILRRS